MSPLLYPTAGWSVSVWCEASGNKGLWGGALGGDWIKELIAPSEERATQSIHGLLAPDPRFKHFHFVFQSEVALNNPDGYNKIKIKNPSTSFKFFGGGGMITGPSSDGQSRGIMETYIPKVTSLSKKCWCAYRHMYTHNVEIYIRPSGCL